ncbi:flippase [Terasakiella sp. SH-1]|uniref:flippase n=1 Tax=Terasakiella sp. SH-1 TaxID=2560057 RepID=UPI00142FA19A|nr:flippase [Terasakiella sp. SH-1]
MYRYLTYIKSLFTNKELAIELIKGSGGTFIINLTSAALIFFYQVFLARNLGAEEYGLYSYTSSFIYLLLILAVFGLDHTSVRFSAKYLADGSSNCYQGLFRFATWSVVITSALCFAVGLILNIWLNIDPDTLWIALISLPFAALMLTWQAFLRGSGHSVLAATPEGLVRPLSFWFCAFLFIYILGAQTTGDVWVGQTIGFGIAAIYAFYILVKKVPSLLKGETKPAFAKKEWFIISLSMLVFNICQAANGQIGTLFLGSIHEIENAGIFSAAIRLATLTAFGLVALNVVVAPLLSKFNATGSKDNLRQLILYAIVGGTGFALPISGVMLVFPEWCLNFFGAQFKSGATSLQVMAFAQLVNAIFGIFSVTALMTMRQVLVAMLVSISVLINILLNYTLIPHYGIDGAAIAYGTAIIFWNFSLFLFFIYRVSQRLKQAS